MRGPRLASAWSRREALLVSASGLTAAIVGIVLSLAMQVGIVLGAAFVAASIVMARAGRVLDPGWVIVAWLYLLGPIGSVLTFAGVGFSAVAMLLLAVSPFVLAALMMRPDSLARLLLMAPMVLLLLLAGLSLGWSADPPYGIEKLAFWSVTSMIPAGFILLLSSGPSRTSWRLIGLAAFVYALGLLVFGASSTLYTGRATILDASPISAAREVYLGALVVLFGPFPSFAKVVMVPLLILAGLATISLGPAIGVLAGAWAGIAASLWHTTRTDRAVAMAWAAFAFLTGLAAVALLGGGLDPFLTEAANDPNVTSRATYLGLAAQLFARAPLLGVGIGGFAATGLDFYPHNLVAEIASELGSVGIMVLLAWFGLAFRAAVQSPILVALVVATSTFTMFSGDLAGNGEFWLLSAMAVAMLPVGHSLPAGDVGDRRRRPMGRSHQPDVVPTSIPGSVVRPP